MNNDGKCNVNNKWIKNIYQNCLISQLCAEDLFILLVIKQRFQLNYQDAI